MSTNQNQQLSLLQTYNKKLQDENLAKVEQIRMLRQQLDKQSSSIGSARIISTSTYNVSNCINCKNKDAEITNLNKSIKQSKQNYQRQIQRLSNQNSQNSTKVQTIYKQIPSSSQTAQLQQLKKAYEQLKLKYEQRQKLQWSNIRIDGQTNDNNQVNQIRQQSEIIKQQNRALLGKIQFLQKRVISLQQANKILRDQIVAHVNVGGGGRSRRGSGVIIAGQPIQRTFISPPQTVTYQTQSQQVPPPQQVTSIAYSIPPPTVSSNVPIPVSVPIFNYISPASLPTFANIPLPQQTIQPMQAPPQNNKSVTFELPKQTYVTQVVEPYPINTTTYSSKGKQTGSHGCTYLSPLSVLGTHHHNHFNTNAYNYSGYDQSYDNDYYKDIVQQRWRSLQHKIKLLQQQNNVLRSQIGVNGYY